MELIIARDGVAGKENAFDELPFRADRPDTGEVGTEGPPDRAYLVTGQAGALARGKVLSTRFRPATAGRFLGPSIELGLLGLGGGHRRVERWLHDFKNGSRPPGEGHAHFIGTKGPEL